VTRIDQRSTEAGKPYANLLPIVEFLVSRGNIAIEGGFVLTQGGWGCLLERPIDFDAVRAEFETPPTVILSESDDSILDRLSWCSIEGPGAHAA